MKVRKLMSANEARSIVNFNEQLLKKTISAIEDALALRKRNAFVCDRDATCENLEMAVSIFKKHLEGLGYLVIVRPEPTKALLEIRWEEPPKCSEEAKND